MKIRGFARHVGPGAGPRPVRSVSNVAGRPDGRVEGTVDGGSADVGEGEVAGLGA